MADPVVTLVESAVTPGGGAVPMVSAEEAQGEERVLFRTWS